MMPDHSWLVEAQSLGWPPVAQRHRLETREEAETYITSHAAFDLRDDGYVTAKAIHCDETTNCSMHRNKKGGRVTLQYSEGSCVLLGWREVEAMTPS